MLAKATGRTHFLTGTSRNIAAWSVRPGQLDHNDTSKRPDLPGGAVRSPYEKKRNSPIDDSFILFSC